ncbi:benzil reductase ((S)-benzoin forming) [Cerasibacillus quisquiliarum]|uniref:Short-chain dehydrogenase n=1 Tax=Cerasibacillus quisquiliarum TaxID=227865 RepID=A0A511UVU1_9BACI|nr:(S)-benzoin forming benzil reductase [Cerasibacillus quisquiliarum]MBB5146418.1 benzil reductase ((S)-benzoin forming) [Cerasibacillus quisquiliarum]GEN30745.1 short-chain dehydrogenase [Cerasibacillus quisquiliarum]
MSKLAVITGTSRGLGHHIATLFLKKKIRVIGLSRHENKNLSRLAIEYQTSYQHMTCDLSNHHETMAVMKQIAAQLKKNQKVYLINNAAMIEPIHQAAKIDPYQLAKHVQVNLTTPMMITNYLLHVLNQKRGTMINTIITSGAAERAVHGWSAYCSTKAAMNRYIETVALEQKNLKTNHMIIGLSPGIMDTEMQTEIRKSTREAFDEVDTFIQYKDNKLLRQPEEIAQILMYILFEEQLSNGKIYDARNYL